MLWVDIQVSQKGHNMNGIFICEFDWFAISVCLMNDAILKLKIHFKANWNHIFAQIQDRFDLSTTITNFDYQSCKYGLALFIARVKTFTFGAELVNTFAFRAFSNLSFITISSIIFTTCIVVSIITITITKGWILASDSWFLLLYLTI